MAHVELIPAIDLRGGRCVRLLRGDFEAETAYQEDPMAVAARYCAAGARWIHVVDLDGALAGEHGQRRLITRLSRTKAFKVKLQVGGGLRSPQGIAEVLRAGAARVVVGSAAVERPDEVVEWLETFGRERVVLAFDVRLDEQSGGGDGGVPRVATHGWREQTGLSLWEALGRYGAGVVQHVLCTDVGRDGAMSGPNLALYAEAVRRFPTVQWQASGGVRDAADLAALAGIGVAAAISGRAMIENRIRRAELKPFLRRE